MRQLSFVAISLAVIFLILSCTKQKQEVIEDITVIYPDNAKVIFDNDYVKAIEFMLKPGDSLPLHKGDPRAIFALSDYKIKWTEDNETSEKEWTKGDVHWHNALEHAIENTGDTEANFLVVARKQASLPETGEYEISHDASEIDTDFSKIAFENEYVRIIETNIPPQAAQSKHHGINRLIYALTDYHIQYTSDKSETKNTQFVAGNAHWHGADEHTVENIGTSPAQYIIFAFKK